MNYKHFAAGVAIGIASKSVIDAVPTLKRQYAHAKHLFELKDLLTETGEFEENPPDEMIDRQEITPDEFFGDIMEEFDTDAAPGSSVELGEPTGNPFAPGDDDEPGITPGGDMMDALQGNLQEINEARILASLQTGAKSWEDLVEDVFGDMMDLFPEDGALGIREEMNRQLDTALQSLQENGDIHQRDDNLYELN